MSILILIIALVATALLSLVGGVLLVLGRGRFVRKVQKWGPAIASVVLAYAVFGDIIPEVSEELSIMEMVSFIIVGFIACAMVGLFMGRYHHHSDLHHHGNHAETHGDNEIKNKAQAYTMLAVDSVHGIADGIVLGVSFLAGIWIGVSTCLATIAHEIPQEVGDFAIMQKAKFKTRRVLFYQTLSSLIIVPSGVVSYLVGEQLLGGLPVVLSIVAGFLLYVALGELSCTIQIIREK